MENSYDGFGRLHWRPGGEVKAILLYNEILYVSRSNRTIMIFPEPAFNIHLSPGREDIFIHVRYGGSDVGINFNS